jgi:hypothetical protein
VEENNASTNTPQLILFLSGSGGTGKSRVIQTFLDFARRWHSTGQLQYNGIIKNTSPGAC